MREESEGIVYVVFGKKRDTLNRFGFLCSFIFDCSMKTYVSFSTRSYVALKPAHAYFSASVSKSKEKTNHESFSTVKTSTVEQQQRSNRRRFPIERREFDGCARYINSVYRPRTSRTIKIGVGPSGGRVAAVVGRVLPPRDYNYNRGGTDVRFAYAP